MSIQRIIFSSSSLSPTSLAPDPDSAASWPTDKAFDTHLQNLGLLPAGASRSPSAVQETEHIYDLASPIKRFLDASESPPNSFVLQDRVATIAAAVRNGDLPVEHARRLLVPSDPSWLTSLNTSWRIRLAHDTLQTVTRASVSSNGTVAAASQSLLRGLLETAGGSPSEVLLSMDLFDNVAWLPPLDRQRATLASRMVDFMYQMQFAEAEIGQVSAVPRQLPPPLPLASQPA
ncbi:hypothetical protein [Mitsuaria sp. 7]|uniref:hypothetical protein n=1 Tax=Mitsuaria sp. 7 TaxID=1658665 RepID=UPI0007DD8369|nr:hypothetical protein [Mitsuaria sp. 7]ANH69369.1 hypothetical protein ABE85_20565 [Mitsuaria sp. 7]